MSIVYILKFSGVIDVLVNNARQIDAVNLAFSFELTEKYSPVSLLKSYLTEARKATSPVKSANASPTVQVPGLIFFTIYLYFSFRPCLLSGNLSLFM